MTDPADLFPLEHAFGGPDLHGDPLVGELASVALEAAVAAAAVVWDRRADTLEEVATKSSATDMVSEVDRQAEQTVGAVLDRRRPADALLGEEGGARPGTTGVRWVVDPLDGTTNYLFGIPAFSVSVAAELEGVTVAGVVADPSRRELWTARAGGGAWLNGRRCQVAEGRSTLATALVATGFGYRPERRAWQAAIAARILPEVRDLRRFGSAALDLCWLGGGRYDGYYEWGLNPWDLAAGMLVCREAGAEVGFLPGHTVVAAVPSLAEPLRALLVQAGAGEPPRGPEPRWWDEGAG